MLLDTLRTSLVFDCSAIGDGALTLLTDGREIFARTASGEFINLLRAPDQPMLVVGELPMLKELTARTKPARKKKKPAVKRTARTAKP